MNHVVLKGLIPEKCVVYIDDTGVYGKTVDEFLMNLREVFERMRSCNVKLKPSKCSLGYKELVFCGHVFGKEGYRLCDDKKSHILQLGEPKCVKDVRRILGMVNFFRDFIPNLSTLVKPLTDMTSTGFVWSEQAQKAWLEVKEAVC